jgi:hypothetical protein
MLIPNLYFLILILLTVLISINSSKLKDDDNLTLIQVEYGYNIIDFTLEVLNRDNAEINDYLSSRIAFMNGSEHDNEIFDLYSQYINKYWIFLVNSSQVADSLLQREDYKKKELYINGIIVPKSLNYKMPSKNNNKKIPIFILKDDIVEKLSSFDIRNMEKHIYFLFLIKRAISSYPEIYFLIVSILLIISGVGLTIFWRIKMKIVTEDNIIAIHRFLYTVPIFLSLYSIALIVKAIDIRGQDPNISYEESIYVDTALITLSSIYKTLLWFTISMASIGWKISVSILRRQDCSFLIKMLLVIYVLTCLDQIIDSTGVQLWVFHLSELKNIVFYAGLLYILITKINRTIKSLDRKLFYARLLSLEFIDALVFKIKLMNKMKIMLYSFVSLWVLILIIHKTLLLPYDTTLLEIYDYALADFYLSVYFLMILMPRILPPFFKTDLGNDMDEDLGLIYKAFLPQYNRVSTLFEENEKEIKQLKDSDTPILILGPCLSHYDAGDKEEVSINNYINNVGIGFINLDK